MQNRNRFKTWKEPIVKIVEAAMSPSGPISAVVLHFMSSPASKSSGLPPNWDLESGSGTSRGGAKGGGGAGERKLPSSSCERAVDQGDVGRKVSLILGGTYSMRRGVAGPREPAGFQWGRTDHFRFPSQECSIAWRK